MTTKLKLEHDKVWVAEFKNYEGKTEEFLVKHNLKVAKSAHPYASIFMYNKQTAKRLAYEQCTLLGVVEFKLKIAEIEYVRYKPIVRILSVVSVK